MCPDREKMASNKYLLVPGIVTFIQALVHIVGTALGFVQYYCVIDFLRFGPIVLFMKAMYFHNPNTCGIRINVGQGIQGVSNQALILLTHEPFTTTRTFYINIIGFSLSLLWLITSAIMFMGGSKGSNSKHVRWPWVTVTSLFCVLDLICLIVYAEDINKTMTVEDVMSYIGGTASGFGGTQINTYWAAGAMAIVYSRLVIFCIINVIFIILVLFDCSRVRGTSPVVNVSLSSSANNEEEFQDTESRDSVHSARLPRATLKKWSVKNLFVENSPQVTGEHLFFPIRRCSSAQQISGKKVKFPKNLLSLPQRLENLIAEQHYRINNAAVKEARLTSVPHVSQSMPHLPTITTATTACPPAEMTRRPCTKSTQELASQLPWCYVQSSGQPMRDYLSDDEDLPPVPLQDYTAVVERSRKYSVHRAASISSSLPIRNLPRTHGQSGTGLKHTDVLY